MILYLDTSALVKRYVMESGSSEVIALIEQADMVGSALLTRVEMASAMSKAVRLNWVDANEAESAWQDFLSHWQSFARLSVTPAIDRACCATCLGKRIARLRCHSLCCCPHMAGNLGVADRVGNL